MENRIAVVTGAGRGIGRGAAFGVARRGARVVVVDVSTDELDTTAAAVGATGADVLPLRADLTRRDQIDRMLDTIRETWGPVDILVNNAAVLHLKPFEETTPAVWAETLQVVLEAPYYLSWRLCGEMLERGRGHIITVSSTAGVKPFALETAYCAAKYGVEGLFRSLALEVTSRGVMVALCTPGKTTKPTSMTDATYAGLPAEERARYASPLVFVEAFGYLAGATDPAISGRRFDLFALAELVREHGWTVPTWLALQRAERNTA